MTVTRRSLLGGALGAGVGSLLVGCSPGQPTPAPGPSGPSGTSDSSGGAPASPAPQASSTRSPAAPRQAQRGALSRDAIRARYDGVSPTRWGTDLRGITAMVRPAGRVAALTFDACGGPGGDGYDAALVDLLRAEQVRATLFLNQRWVAANPRAFADLAADPLFDIADHGTRHVPLSVTGRAAYGIAGTRDPGQVYDEVVGNALDLERRLHRPITLVRPGTAHYDDVAVQIVRDLGMVPVGFDVNGDAGATFTPRQVQAAMRTVRSGSIVIAHLNHPGHGTAAGMALALPRLKRAGFRFVHVADHLS